MSIFMNIANPVIAGNSTVKGEANAFSIYSFSWGAGELRSSTGFSAKASISSMTVSFAAYNGPAILESLVQGKVHHITITVTAPDNVGRTTAYETFKLTDAYFVSYQEAGSTEVPSVTLQISFGKIELDAQSAIFAYDVNTGSLG